MLITETLLDDLQGDAPVREVLMGAFWTAVVLDADPVRCGLASTLRGESDHRGPPIPEAGDLLSFTARGLAQWMGAPQTLKASVGLAAYNALLGVDEQACVELNASDVIRHRAAGRRVAIVGHFPFVQDVRRTADTCWVLELNPRPGDVPARRADELLPRADVVAITSTSLINHTFDGLISLCCDDAFVIMLGPSTPLSPVLLAADVNVLSGTVVEDVEPVLRSISQGATFRQIKRGGGLRLLTMAYGAELQGIVEGENG
ncbi:MAG: DUF364 domain-containing protein [Anaerolineae bacterium]